MNNNKIHYELPREKAQSKGVQSISDRELLAVFLGRGIKNHPINSLASVVLERLDGLGPSPQPQDLEGIPGLGLVRRLQICAGLELFRRIHLPGKHRITQAKDLMPILNRWADRSQEHFFSISLNGANEVIRCSVVSIGTVNRALVHPREVFAPAIHDRAAALIIAHNHPSGNVEPSKEDRDVTKRMGESGQVLGIPLLDHVVFGMDGYLSFAEKGLL